MRYLKLVGLDVGVVMIVVYFRVLVFLSVFFIEVMVEFFWLMVM